MLFPKPVRLPLGAGRITDPEAQRILESKQKSALIALRDRGQSVLQIPVRKQVRRMK
jgi:hypothetical protein